MTITEQLKSTGITNKALKDFLYAITSTMVDYYGLDLTKDDKLIYTYTPVGSPIDYQCVLEKDFNKILKFLDIKIPKADKLGFVNLYDLFSSIVESNKFNKRIYSLTELYRYVKEEDVFRKKTMALFMRYITTVSGYEYLYPLEDILIEAILDYNFPKVNLYKFQKDVIKKDEEIRMRRERVEVLDKATIRKWLPELVGVSDTYIIDLIAEFEKHVNLYFKQKFADYVSSSTIKDIKEDLAAFYVEAYSPE